MGKYGSYKEQVLRYSQRLVTEGYLFGTGGNVSVLVDGEEAIAVTPSSRDYMELAAEDISVVDFDLKPIEGEHSPSIETGMHVAIYKNRPDAGAVIHTHQRFASVMAVLGEPIPPLFDESVMNIGPVVDIVPYAPSGSSDLAANVASKLANGCNCYIIQNHGALSLGSNIAKAYLNTGLLEKNAHVYYMALSTGKKISTLPEPGLTLFSQLLKARQDAAAAGREARPPGEVAPRPLRGS